MGGCTRSTGMVSHGREGAAQEIEEEIWMLGRRDMLTPAVVGYNPDHHKKKERHKSADYNEAWVEFLDKSVAKTVASMLNAQVIGGKKGDR